MTKRISLLIAIALLCSTGTLIAGDPTISPTFFKSNDVITVTYDVTGTALSSLTSAYAWVWIPGKNVNAKYNVNPASSDATKTDLAKFTKSNVSGRTLFTITFTPSTFFSGDISLETQLGILLKGNNWSDGQTSDCIAKFWNGSFKLNLVSPAQQPLFINSGSNILIDAVTPQAADFDLFIDNVLVDEQNAITNYAYTHQALETSGSTHVRIVATATSGVNSDESEFEYIISTPSVIMSRPIGIIPGINYDQVDPTKVTLCLWAPGKNSVYAVGDFNNWEISSNYQLKKDGEFFWVEVTGITPAEEYAFYYLVDEKIRVSDPYADKILDIDDQYIPESTYPDLKTFPSKAISGKWYENRVSVFQTAQTNYEWIVTDFEKPAKEGLVIYELLIRDFFDDQHRNYQSLIDTIVYFKRLGINAIELMPIMEFNGNEGWGYNPTFMFAPDKYYGTKNKLKEFVDKCHENGIAVILDIAMNHQDIPNTYAAMYFDYTSFKPTGNNPWFNVTARHPFNVFFDMNHESSYTKAYLDTITHYWLNEFKADGFRFDLSKGFTQKNNPTDVDAWGKYDLSRINILKRMADKIWSHTPDAYVILEHFAENTEEKELAEYRAAENKGMMLWGNLNYAYAQNTMGYSENSDISGISSENRGWTTPHVVGYMESHDEERLMYKNGEFGKVLDNYSAKDKATALDRMKAATALFYTIPGPKMLWEFGELGYDYSINYCEDGTIKSDCRLSPKPAKWEYNEEEDRIALFNHISTLMMLRKTHTVFTLGSVAIIGGSTLTKQVSIKNNPYTATPSSTEEMNVVVVANFDVKSKKMPVNFPHTGAWYNYFANNLSIIAAGVADSVNLTPGSFKLYTDFPIKDPIFTSSEIEVAANNITLYPNPVEDIVTIELEKEAIRDLQVLTLHGEVVRPLRTSKNTWNVSALPHGLYIAEVHSNRKSYRIKMIKK